MNNTIKTTIFSPLSDLQFKAGFDNPIRRRGEKETDIARTGSVVFADGRKIDKDVNTQQNMSVQQFVPVNGFLPVFSISRGLNVIEQSLKTARPDLTPFQIRDRPKFLLDPALDKYIDHVFDNAIAPKLSLLDDERVLYQQFRQSVGMYSQKIKQLPLTDVQADKAAKVARLIEHDSAVFNGAPMEDAVGTINDADLLQAPDSVRPDAFTLKLGTGLAEIDKAYVSGADMENIDFDEQVQLGGLWDGLAAHSARDKDQDPDEYPILNLQQFGKEVRQYKLDAQQVYGKYLDYLKSDAYRLARMKANNRERRMQQTGIPFYMTAFGKDIEQALSYMNGDYIDIIGGNNIPLTHLNTRLSRHLPGAERTHDVFRYLKDHLTKKEWKHFTEYANIKQEWYGRQGKYKPVPNAPAVVPGGEEFEPAAALENLNRQAVNMIMPNEENKGAQAEYERALREQEEIKQMQADFNDVPDYMEQPGLYQDMRQYSRGNQMGRMFKRGFAGLAKASLLFLMANAGMAYARGQGAGGGLFGATGQQVANPTMFERDFMQAYGRAMGNVYQNQPAGPNMNALLQNQLYAQQAAAIGTDNFAQAARDLGIGDWAGLHAAQMGMARVLPAARAQPLQPVNGALDAPQIALQHDVMQNVNEEIPNNQGAVDAQAAMVQDPINPALPGDPQIPIPLAADQPGGGVAAIGGDKLPDALRLHDPATLALLKAPGGEDLLNLHVKEGTTLTNNLKTLEAIEQEKIMQDRWGVSWPTRAIGLTAGGTAKNELPRRFGRTMGVKTADDIQHLAQITMMSNGKIMTADGIPARGQLQEIVEQVYENIDASNNIRSQVKQVALKAMDVQKTADALKAREDEIRQQMSNNDISLADGNQQIKDLQVKQTVAQTQMDQVARSIKAQTKVLTKAQRGNQVDTDKIGVDQDVLKQHLINNNWTEWLADKAKWVYEIMGVLGIAATVGVIGVSAALAFYWHKITGIKMVVQAAANRIIPSVQAAASLATIQKATGIPLEGVYNAYNSLQHKFSESAAKHIPSNETMMTYLSEQLARAQQMYQLHGQGYVQSAQELMGQGLTSGLGFARNYLQPVAERYIANDLVTMQSARDTSKRKTLNILGKRYKKKQGQAAQMIDVMMKRPGKRQKFVG